MKKFFIEHNETNQNYGFKERIDLTRVTSNPLSLSTKCFNIHFRLRFETQNSLLSGLPKKIFEK